MDSVATAHFALVTEIIVVVGDVIIIAAVTVHKSSFSLLGAAVAALFEPDAVAPTQG